MRESVDENEEWNGEISTFRCPHCGVVPIPMSGLKPSSARPLLLVVDDEPAILKIIERLAGKLGFDVVTCLSGAEALGTLMRRPADLAMVDLRMPDVNGLDLLRQIRRRVPGGEVILMTGHAPVHSAAEAFKPGLLEDRPKRLILNALGDL